MIGAIGMAIRTPSYSWNNGAAQRVRRDQPVQQDQPRLTLTRAPQTGKPVTPVTAVTPARDATFDKSALLNYMQYNAAEGAVRSRIQYLGNEAANQTENGNQPGSLAPEQGKTPALPGQQEESEAKLPGQEKAAENVIRLPGSQDGEGSETKTQSAREVAEAAECQTCKRRKYQDGSDDPGVSFKTPTHIAPEQAAAKVRGHENEHVTREQAKADREGRKVVMQSVSYRTAICPECGRVYVAGGQTRTVTMGEQKQEDQAQKEDEPAFSAVA